MDEPSDKGNKGLETSGNKSVEEYVAGLSNEHRMLVLLID